MSRTAHPVAGRTFPGNACMEAQPSRYRAVCTKPVWALRGFLVVAKGETMEKCCSINARCAIPLVLSPEDALIMVRH